jgi:hypothetical protein
MCRSVRTSARAARISKSVCARTRQLGCFAWISPITNPAPYTLIGISCVRPKLASKSVGCSNSLGLTVALSTSHWLATNNLLQELRSHWGNELTDGHQKYVKGTIRGNFNFSELYGVTSSLSSSLFFIVQDVSGVSSATSMESRNWLPQPSPSPWFLTFSHRWPVAIGATIAPGKSPSPRWRPTKACHQLSSGRARKFPSLGFSMSEWRLVFTRPGKHTKNQWKITIFNG